MIAGWSGSRDSLEFIGMALCYERGRDPAINIQTRDSFY